MTSFKMTPKGPHFPGSPCLNPPVPHGFPVTPGLLRGSTPKPPPHPTQPCTVCKTHAASSILTMPWDDSVVSPLIKRISKQGPRKFRAVFRVTTGLGLEEGWSFSPASSSPLPISPPILSLFGAAPVLLSSLCMCQFLSLEHDAATTYLQSCPTAQVSTLRPPFHLLQEAFYDDSAVQAMHPLLVHPARLPVTVMCLLDAVMAVSPSNSECHSFTHIP